MHDELIKSILYETILTIILVRNIFMLRKARALRRDVKAGRTEKVKARITLVRPSIEPRGSMARGVYDKDGRKIKCSMICACSMHYIHRKDEKEVIVGESDGRFFALDEKQSRDAVITWWVFTFLPGVYVLIFLVDIVFQITK